MMQRKIALLGLLLGFGALPSVQALEVGGKAPDCHLATLADGQHLDLAQFKGKTIYLDFWASWCLPCAKSFPFMNAMNRDLKAKGLVVVAVNLDEEPEDGKAFLANNPAEFTVAVDSTKHCAEAFGVDAMPSTYLIDAEGVLRHAHLGFKAGEAEQMRAFAEQMLATQVSRQ